MGFEMSKVNKIEFQVDENKKRSAKWNEKGISMRSED